MLVVSLTFKRISIILRSTARGPTPSSLEFVYAGPTLLPIPAKQMAQEIIKIRRFLAVQKLGSLGHVLFMVINGPDQVDGWRHAHY